MVLEKMSEYGAEAVHYYWDKETGLRAIVVIHCTALGPATGGTRFIDYKSEEEALFDVLRLSRGMTYKNACSGVMRGGAKGVIIGDPAKLKTEALCLAYGRFVNSLGGIFTTGEDMNITEKDVEIMARETEFVAGRGGEGRGGDPSPYTSRGVFRGIQAGAEAKYGSKSLKGKTVAVLGIGKVGYTLCKWLHEDGAKLIAADVNPAAAEKAKSDFGAQIVKPEEIMFVDCDVFSPNAGGAIIDEAVVSKLKCTLVGGGANNVLVNNAAGDALDKKGILYIPDYVINAGGVISIDMEIRRIHTEELVNQKMDGIYDNVKTIMEFAKKENLPTYLAADRYAEKVVAEARKKK